MYWNTEADGVFPGMNFGKVIPQRRFEEIIGAIQYSHSPDPDQQILDLIDAVNACFAEAISPGDILVLDESMVKSYHRNLHGEIKIIRKLRPIGNEIKNLADGRTNIVLKLELYEGREPMSKKKHVDKYGATSATTPRLTEEYHGTGRIVIADSWFGSIKSVIAVKKLACMTTCSSKLPTSSIQCCFSSRKELPGVNGKDTLATINGVTLQAVDMKDKFFIATCLTSLAGKGRITRHHRVVPRPKVAEQYLASSAVIDIHNHTQTGSVGFEDAWQTIFSSKLVLT